MQPNWIVSILVAIGIPYVLYYAHAINHAVTTYLEIPSDALIFLAFLAIVIASLIWWYLFLVHLCLALCCDKEKEE